MSSGTRAASLLRAAIPVAAVLLAAKAASMLLALALPDEGVELAHRPDNRPAYRSYPLNNMIADAAPSPGSRAESQQQRKNDVMLKGIYGNADRGYAVVALKSRAAETRIIGLGEAFHGWVLQAIEPRGALFASGSELLHVTIESAPPNGDDDTKSPRTGERL